SFFTHPDDLKLRVNPTVSLRAAFAFPMSHAARREAMVSLGETYSLSGERTGDHQISLTSRDLGSTTGVVVDERELNELMLSFNPTQRTVSVKWNGSPALTHHIRVLVTSPAQIR